MVDITSDETVSGEQPLGSSDADKLVVLARFNTANEAELCAAVLEGEGIHAEVFGANFNEGNWYWQGSNSVELNVRAGDVERAAEILANTGDDDLEPDDEAEAAAPAVDEQGRELVPAVAFETVAAMRDAQTVLASAKIASYVPRLVPRGDRPPGVGARFVVKVAIDDLEHAQDLLAEEARDDSEDPRCPKCSSWRVHPKSSMINEIAGVVGLKKPPTVMECLACGYKGATGEFVTGWVDG
jgi:hypothetical protein